MVTPPPPHWIRSDTKTEPSDGLNLRQWQGRFPWKAPRRKNHELLLLSRLNRTMVALMINTSITTLTTASLCCIVESSTEYVMKMLFWKQLFTQVHLYEETIWIITGMSHLPSVSLTACVCWPVIRLHMKHKQMHNISLESTERLIRFPVRVMLRTCSERPRLSVFFLPLTWALVSEGH